MNFINDYNKFWNNDYAKLPQSLTCLFFSIGFIINAYNLIYNLYIRKLKKSKSDYDPKKINMAWIFVILLAQKISECFLKKLQS